jgi:hypothetical protein
MVASMGMPGLAGMFGGASMSPQGAGGFDPTNAMGQLGQGTPQAPTGAWATNPSAAPPWFQAAMQSPGGVHGYLQNMQAQQLAAKQAGQGGPNPQQLAAWQAMQAGQGQMPQGPGILSGMGGQMPWGPQQPPRGWTPPPMPQYRQPVRPPPQQAPRLSPGQASRRAVYGGGSAVNISLSGY